MVRRHVLPCVSAIQADRVGRAEGARPGPDLRTLRRGLLTPRMPANRATAEKVLGADDPLPVRVLRPEGRSDFLLTADHAGRAIPRRLGTLGLPASELARHTAWDIGLAGVTERLSEALGAATVLQNYSRLVVDCNRTP